MTDEHKKWWVETLNDRLEAPEPVSTERGFVVRWKSPASGYHRETPPVATRSGAVAMWAALSGHTIESILMPSGMGYGSNRCQSCQEASARTETQEEADARDGKAGWRNVMTYPICPQCAAAYLAATTRT
jgi:hypothetical protein